MVKKEKETGGGSESKTKGISVKSKEVKKKEIKEEIAEETPEETAEETIEETEELSEEVIEVNKAVIETICVSVSRIVVALTGIEELAFDESEVEQLKNLWSPFMPVISPLGVAVIGTIIIVGGKAGIYAIKRKEAKKKKPSKSEKTRKEKAGETK